MPRFCLSLEGKNPLPVPSKRSGPEYRLKRLPRKNPIRVEPYCLASSTERLDGAPGRRKRPRADFDKWRHVPKYDLQTAAQLWCGEQPAIGMFGGVKETYAMLCGAIQTGDLQIGFNPTVDPRMQTIVRQSDMENPRPDMKVARTALKAFAKRHNYDPEFLRDK